MARGSPAPRPFSLACRVLEALAPLAQTVLLAVLLTLGPLQEAQAQSDDAPMTVDIAAQTSGTGTLPTVTMTARAERADGLLQVYPGGQVARGGQAGLLGNQDFMDTPLSIAIYTAQVIEDQ